MEPNKIDTEMKESVPPIPAQAPNETPAKKEGGTILLLFAAGFFFLGIFSPTISRISRISLLLIGASLLWFVRLSKENPRRPWVEKLLHKQVNKKPVSNEIPLPPQSPQEKALPQFHYWMRVPKILFIISIIPILGYEVWYFAMILGIIIPLNYLAKGVSEKKRGDANIGKELIGYSLHYLSFTFSGYRIRNLRS